jgi:hypothetical protein
MAEEFGNNGCHSLSPISRGQRGNLANCTWIDTYEDNTSITNASVFLEIPSNRSSYENRLQLDSALRNGLGVVLNAPSGCTHAGVLGA